MVALNEKLNLMAALQGMLSVMAGEIIFLKNNNDNTLFLVEPIPFNQATSLSKHPYQPTNHPAPSY